MGKTYIIRLCTILGILIALPGLHPGQSRAQSIDLTLEDAINLAQERSPSSKVAERGYLTQYWTHQAYRARFLPQLSLGVGAPNLIRAIESISQDDGTTRFRARQQANSALDLSLRQYIPTTGGTIYLQSNINRVDLFGTQNIYYWQSSPVVLGLSQPIFQFDETRWSREIENIQYRLSRREYLEQMADLTIDVIDEFFNVYIAEISVNIARFNATINDTIYSIAQGRYTVGNIAENDLLQSELALINARTQLENALLSYDHAKARLKTLLGIPQETTIGVIPPEEPLKVQVEMATALDQAKQNRSAYIEQELREHQAERTLARARSDARFSTTINARVGYNQTGDTFATLYDRLQGQQFFNVQMEVPLVQWGSGKAEIASARNALERIEHSNEIQREELLQEVRYMVRNFQLLQDQLLIAAKTDTIASRRFTVSKDRYLIGKIDITNLQIAQNEKDMARRNYMQTLRNYWTTYYQLEEFTLYDFVHQRPVSYRYPEP